ncbi:hypothetical protein [Flagellimonas sp. CMM7]|uniref:hypothetical protein n=1 Tax=Flagellimonas sp. CMM7 TaxID=2654676 RepID=UPI0013D147A1|nr:hypothetical protein [Flagellimonas sp. CMM7]UII81587.1 hypothetical protein LV704_08740 [Flagellimonas sp. CMM7]
MFFKQSKPSTVIILGVFMLLLTLLLIYEGTVDLNQIIGMTIIGTVLLSYSISYELRGDFDNIKHFKLFGLSLFKQRFTFSSDYISVFSTSAKKSSDWGPIAAMGKGTRNEHFVIRLFKENEHFTVFRSKSCETVVPKATELGRILNIEVIIKQ